MTLLEDFDDMEENKTVATQNLEHMIHKFNCKFSKGIFQEEVLIEDISGKVQRLT